MFECNRVESQENKEYQTENEGSAGCNMKQDWGVATSCLAMCRSGEDKVIDSGAGHGRIRWRARIDAAPGYHSTV